MREETGGKQAHGGVSPHPRHRDAPTKPAGWLQPRTTTVPHSLAQSFRSCPALWKRSGAASRGWGVRSEPGFGPPRIRRMSMLRQKSPPNRQPRCRQRTRGLPREVAHKHPAGWRRDRRPEGAVSVRALFSREGVGAGAAKATHRTLRPTHALHNISLLLAHQPIACQQWGASARSSGTAHSPTPDGVGGARLGAGNLHGRHGRHLALHLCNLHFSLPYAQQSSRTQRVF